MNEKVIVIDVSDNENVSVKSTDCIGQDLYVALCAYIGHIKAQLINPNELENMIKTALKDVEKIIPVAHTVETINQGTGYSH